MRAGAVIAGFAAVLAAPTAAIWLYHSSDLEPALLSIAFAGWLAIAALAFAVTRSEQGARLLPSSSLSTVLVAIGVAMVLNGLAFGLWLVLVGAEVVLLGAIGLAGELRARRGAR